MIICEKCGAEFSEEAEKCPSCAAANPIYEPIETDEQAELEVDEAEEGVPSQINEPDPLEGHVDMDDEVEQKSLVSVYQAENEMMANVVKGLLEGEGIPAFVDSKMVPWLNGVMKSGEGYFGDVIVPESEADRSREIIKAYREAAPEETAEEDLG